MKIFKADTARNAMLEKKEPKVLSEKELSLVSGGVAESPPPAHDMLVRPGDTKGIAL